MWLKNGRLIASGTLFPPPPPSAHEVLGWAYIPIFLTVGSLLLLLTNSLIRASLRVSQRWQLQISGPSHSS
jgi:hypothetical protein